MMRIEQMFEDIPNTAFSRVSPSSHRPANKSNRVRASLMRPAVHGVGVHGGGGGVGTAASASTVSTASTASNASVSATTSASRAKGRTSRKTSGSSVRKSSRAASYRSVLDHHGDQLSAFEQQEIMNYSQVYFWGPEANKGSNHGCGPGNNNGFDDGDHFYRVLAKDHVAYRFEVDERPHLGKGTFGQVIRAYDHKAKQWVALKMVRNEKVYLNQSKEELRILQFLRRQEGPGAAAVVRMIDFFMFRNHMVFSFELLGINLYQLLKRQQYKGLPPQKIAPIVRAVLRCLELLFKHRIIHCDIKPENIMLKRSSDTTSIKVGDFGSSCYEQQQKYHYIQSRYYRAPEVILGLRYGPAIDVWSLGCVVGELARGTPLLVGEDETDQLAAMKEVLGEPPRALTSRARSRVDAHAASRRRGKPGSRPLDKLLEGDDNFKDIVRRMLLWEPEVRPTPAELQAHPWLAGAPPSAPVTPRPKLKAGRPAKSAYH